MRSAGASHSVDQFVIKFTDGNGVAMSDEPFQRWHVDVHAP